jgi:hypothetical protein
MSRIEQFQYDNRIVRAFGMASFIFGIVGMLVGLILAFQLIYPALNLSQYGIPISTFGRLRPLHTNAVIFAFVGNGIFMGVYYSLQRLLKARMFSDPVVDTFLGLAGDHSLRSRHAADGDYHQQRICRIGLADRPAHHPHLGRFWDQHVRHHSQTPGKPPVCGYLVLHRHLDHGCRVAHCTQH